MSRVKEVVHEIGEILNCDASDDICGGWRLRLDGPDRHDQCAVLRIRNGAWKWEFIGASFNGDLHEIRRWLAEWVSVVRRVQEAERVLRACQDLRMCTDGEPLP